MIRKFTLALIFCSSVAALQAQTVRGIVFEDQNNNGKKERKEPGVANVGVSNGTQVVLTDQDGQYELPVGEDNAIFVVKPADYTLPVDKNNLPQFYYIHKPQGAPDLEFETVAPTGKLPKSVDFPLMPTEEKENFTALLFGDPQPYTQEEVEFFARGIVSEVEDIEDVPFGLSLGDLVGDDLTLFDPYIRAVQKVGIPWFNLMGNHDMNYDAATDFLSDETYEAHFGPANYAFNYGKVHFIILDDVLYPDPRDGQGYWGGFRKDQLDFVENNLKHVSEDQLIVLAFHIPISEPEEGDIFRDEDRQRLFSILKRFPHTLSLSAHTHLQKHDFFGQEKGWPQAEPHHHYNVGTTSGDWYSGKLDEEGIPVSTMRDGTPKGYAFLHFEGNQYTFDYKVAGKPEDYKMQIFTPKVVPHGQRTSAGIVVNFFQGSEKDSLVYKVDDGEWQGMHLVEDYDPSYLHLLHEWDVAESLMSGRRPSNPVQTKHLWRASIPTNLETGEHTIEVKATDMFGRIFTQQSTYRIEESIQEASTK